MFKGINSKKNQKKPQGKAAPPKIGQARLITKPALECMCISLYHSEHLGPLQWRGKANSNNNSATTISVSICTHAHTFPTNIE